MDFTNKNFEESLKEFFDIVLYMPYFDGLEVVIANKVNYLASCYDISLEPFKVEFDQTSKTIHIRKLIDE